MRQFGSLKSPSICPQLTGTQLVRDTHGITRLDVELASYGNYIIGYQLYQIFINIIIQSTNRLNFCLEILCISLDLIRARIKHKQHQCLERPVWGPDESSNVATGNSTHKHRILSTLSFVNTQMVNGKYCKYKNNHFQESILLTASTFALSIHLKSPLCKHFFLVRV